MARTRRGSPILLLAVTLLATLLVGCTDVDKKDTAEPKDLTNRPNILQLVLDDVGYSDLGPFGGEVPTPAIDALVKSGVKFTDFHSLPNCSPTRAVLLTGVDNHKAGLGNMAETLIPEQVGKPGYEGILNDRVATVPELLRQEGYHTYMVGKWHLGSGPMDPANRGFEESFTILQGLGGHFQVQQAYEGAKTTYTRNGRVVPPPDGVFGAANDTNQLIDMIDANRADNKPFFAHWAVRMAHDPLQAPADVIAKFRGKYDQGYDVLRADRVKRMKDMGLIPQNADTARREPNVEPWTSLTPEDQQRRIREMEVYAAMISVTDTEVGRLVEYLRSVGELDNTQIVLLSDNGPNGETIAFYGADDINRRFDNRLDNIGNRDSFALYGPGWAQASVGPYRLYKGFVAEGGIRTALVISGPAVVEPGRTSTALAQVSDVSATILEMAGVAHPATFKDKPILPLQGKSILPVLTNTSDSVHAADEALSFEIWGRAAVRKGEWKMLWVEPPYGSGQWELYNLRTDIAESKDLSKEQPQKVDELLADWDRYVKDNGVILALGRGIGG